MKFGLSFKILTTVFVMNMACLSVVLYSYYKSYLSSEKIVALQKISLEKEHTLSSIERQFGLMIQEWKNTLLRGKNPEALKKHSAGMDQAIEIQKKLAAEFDRLLDPKEAALLKLYLDNLLNLEASYKNTRAEFITETRFEPSSADAAVKGLDRKVIDPLIELSSLSATLSDSLQKSSLKQASDELSMFSILIFLGALVAMILIYFLIKGLSTKLSFITESVSAASRQVTSASTKLSKSSSNLSAASQNQASSIEEASASLTEISGMAEANHKGAEQARGAVQNVYNISESTRKSMDQLSTAMSEILAATSRIEKLVTIISEVGEKTEIIHDIVFKTQLLSFNASVEAERAGEHGRGFAVVAQEVGNLAQLSGRAALEISSIVKGSIKEAELVALENKKIVTAGGSLTNQTKIQIDQMVNMLSDVQSSISKIVDASKEQGLGVGQISTSVESISSLTQQTAGTAEETATSSSELFEQARSLLQSVGDLEAIVYGSTNKESLDLNTLSLNSDNTEIATASRSA